MTLTMIQNSHHHGLADEENGRAEEAGEGLRLQGEPVAAEDGFEMLVGQVKAEEMRLGRGGVGGVVHDAQPGLKEAAA